MKPVIGITTDVESEYLRLNRQYAEAIEKAGACPVLLPPLRDTDNAAHRIDGLLIPGGDDLHPSYYHEKLICEMKIANDDRTNFELRLVREIIKSGKPVLGICYGMQLINVALGGSLYQDIGLQRPMAMDHKKDYHTIRVENNRLIHSGEFGVNSSHHQAVKLLGKDLKAIAFSTDNIIEAFCMEGYPFLLGVQWHPERLNDDMSAMLFKSFTEASVGSK